MSVGDAIPARSGLGAALLWGHAGLFGLAAGAGYFAPEVLFGQIVALHTAAVAVKLLAAALLALAILLAAGARSAPAGQVKAALLCIVLIDFQAPVFMAANPSMLHHIEHGIALYYVTIPIAFAALVGLAAFELSRMSRRPRQS